MYEPISTEFLDTNKSTSNASVATTSGDREKFLENFLAEYLNSEKAREIGSLKDKLKYKHHQLELASKQMRKAEKKKRDQEALASGLTSNSNQKVAARKRLLLNLKKRKSLKLFKLDKSESFDYSKYEQINKLWHSYATSCLIACFGTPTNNKLYEENVLNCLKQMDYHGCDLTVTKSNTKSLIGVNGLVLQDKKNVFYLLTKENKLKMVPKFGSLFEFELMGFCKMTLVGTNFCVRPEVRSTKHAKIKTKNVK